MSPVTTLRRRDAGVPGSWPAQVPALLQRIYCSRGAGSIDLAQPRLANLLPPDSLLGLEAATALLAEAIATDRHIVVVGDFDCDGATACAVGVRGLRMLGARRVSHAVPNRMVHGYGLSPALVDELAALQPDLLVTVDHGIACNAGITAAKARGWQVLVTDHHLPGVALPPADAIVDPNQPGDLFPSKVLAGVGVMFYVLLALRRRLRDAGSLDGTGPDLSSLLDLVAVGTVADLVPLDANNRALVSAGLRRWRAGQGCAAVVRPEKLRVEHADGAAPADDLPRVEGVVESSLYLGTATQIVVALGEGARMTVLVPNADEGARQGLPGGGAKVSLSWAPEHTSVVRDSANGVPAKAEANGSPAAAEAKAIQEA